MLREWETGDVHARVLVGNTEWMYVATIDTGGEIL